MALFAGTLEALVKPLLLSLVAALLLVGCGSRTPMDCSPGTADCVCNVYGSCHAGLMCVDGWCESESALASTGGTTPVAIGQGGSGGLAMFTFPTGGAVGITGTGGRPGTGGSSSYPGTGGRPGAGGAIMYPTGGWGPLAAGGYAGTGGRPGVGGAGTGGYIATGGSLNNGGRSAGGAVGSAGRSGNRVDFADGKAQGIMSGYGWVSMGQLDTLSQPTCGGLAITGPVSCPAYAWPSSSGLCISGGMPSLPASPTQTDYDANWGVMVSADVTDPPGGTLGTNTFQTITFVYSGASAGVTVRGLLHRLGDPSDVNYCANVQSNQAVTLTSFNTKCWGDASTVVFLSSDLAKVDWVGLQIPSSYSLTKLSNLCLNSVMFK
jgi:hypothetical protein